MFVTTLNIPYLFIIEMILPTLYFRIYNSITAGPFCVHSPFMLFRSNCDHKLKYIFHIFYSKTGILWNIIHIQTVKFKNQPEKTMTYFYYYDTKFCYTFRLFIPLFLFGNVRIFKIPSKQTSVRHHIMRRKKVLLRNRGKK